jgi:hypothetical protein
MGRDQSFALTREETPISLILRMSLLKYSVEMQPPEMTIAKAFARVRAKL